MIVYSRFNMTIYRMWETTLKMWWLCISLLVSQFESYIPLNLKSNHNLPKNVHLLKISSHNISLRGHQISCPLITSCGGTWRAWFSSRELQTRELLQKIAETTNSIWGNGEIIRKTNSLLKHAELCTQNGGFYFDNSQCNIT